MQTEKNLKKARKRGYEKLGIEPKALGLLFHFPVLCLMLSNVLLMSVFLPPSPPLPSPPFPLQSCTLDTTLVGHSAPVTSAIFSPYHAHTTVVTVSEDRTFKVRTLLIFVLPVSFILWVGKNTIASFEYWDQDGCLCGWLAGAGLLWVSVLLVGLYYCLNFSSVCRTCGAVLPSQL